MTTWEVRKTSGGRVPSMMAYTERLSPAGKLRGSIFGLQVYERVEVSLVEVYERVGKSVMSVSKRF